MDQVQPKDLLRVTRSCVGTRRSYRLLADASCKIRLQSLYIELEGESEKTGFYSNIRRIGDLNHWPQDLNSSARPTVLTLPLILALINTFIWLFTVWMVFASDGSCVYWRPIEINVSFVSAASNSVVSFDANESERKRQSVFGERRICWRRFPTFYAISIKTIFGDEGYGNVFSFSR